MKPRLSSKVASPRIVIVSAVLAPIAVALTEPQRPQPEVGVD